MFAGNTRGEQPFSLIFGSFLGILLLFGSMAFGRRAPRITLRIIAGAMSGTVVAVIVDISRGDLYLIPSAIACLVFCYLAFAKQVRSQS